MTWPTALRRRDTNGASRTGPLSSYAAGPVTVAGYISCGTMTMREAAFALIAEDERRLLLLEHSYVEPPLWGFPGGMLEPGETVAEAAVREVEEETGLQVAVGDLVCLLHREDLTLHFFAARRTLGKLRLQTAEISAARWLAPDEALSLGDRLGPRVPEVLAAYQGLLAAVVRPAL